MAEAEKVLSREERIASLKSAPPQAPFKKDPEEAASTVRPSPRRRTRREAAETPKRSRGRGDGTRRFSASMLCEMTPEQLTLLKSFRELDMSASALVRACITKVGSDPKLLAEIRAIARVEEKHRPGGG